MLARRIAGSEKPLGPKNGRHTLLPERGLIAPSFARIFYRNAINLGLPILICPDAARAARPGDHVRVDSESGLVAVAGQRFSAQPFPPFVQELIHAGGLVAWVRGARARRQTA